MKEKGRRGHKGYEGEVKGEGEVLGVYCPGPWTAPPAAPTVQECAQFYSVLQFKVLISEVFLRLRAAPSLAMRQGLGEGRRGRNKEGRKEVAEMSGEGR